MSPEILGFLMYSACHQIYGVIISETIQTYKMKVFLMKNLVFCCLLVLPIAKAGAQVTIGSLTPTTEAAVLDVKTIDPSNPLSPTHTSNITSLTGGIGLPRVMLENITSLEPFIAENSVEWINNTGKIKEKHTGLMVYNIYESAANENNPDKIFKKGIYIWNGSRWSIAGSGEGGKKYFFMPAFNLPLAKVTDPKENDVTFNLYDEYLRQYDKTSASVPKIFITNSSSLNTVFSPENGKLYARDELDYVVTYYDPDVITVTGINQQGLISYRILDNKPDETFLINIVFVIKK